MDPLLDSLPVSAPVDLEQTFLLLGRARAGDREALNAICTRYQERILRVVRVRLGPRLRRWTESSDVMQEVFREALEKIRTLELTREFDLLDWLSRVATNRIRDLVDHVHADKRDIARRQPLSEREGTGAASPALVDPQTTPHDAAYRSEVRELLDEVLSGLPEPYREVILMRDYQGAEWTDIARVLETPSQHAAQQLHQRAWIKLRAVAERRL